MSKKPSCFVANIDLALASKLREDLMDQGFEISTPPHTIFNAQKKGISCALYQSGKLTVQGKDKEEFIAFYLEPEILKNLAYTYPETLVDLTPRIGIDEAGKGDFFGPLCVAGVFAGNETLKELLSLNVRDSKRLSDQAIVEVAQRIRQKFPHHVIRIFPQKYNELYQSFKNLNQLLAWGHAATIEQLSKKANCTTVIVDQFGGEHLIINALKKKNLSIDLTQRHYGESDPLVAAASILARDGFLSGLEQLSQEIGIALPKGASNQVIEIGKKIVAKYGREILEKIAKTHFKTTQMILKEE
ncbi:MAG: ribonuclease HIII [Chlamydiae bacterium]|nr:ribonuclease HIII [Chlamydiota bacterium]